MQIFLFMSLFSVTQACLILCNLMHCRRPGFPVLHYLPEFALIHVYWVGDAIQPSHPLSSPSPPALNLSQHQIFPVSQLFTSGGQNIGIAASVLPVNSQDWFPLKLTGLMSLLSKGLLSVLQHSSKASALQCSAFSVVQFSHPHMTTRKTIALTIQTFVI